MVNEPTAKYLIDQFSSRWQASVGRTVFILTRILEICPCRFIIRRRIFPRFFIAGRGRLRMTFSRQTIAAQAPDGKVQQSAFL